MGAGMRRPDYSRHAKARPLEAVLFRLASSSEPLLEGLTRWHIARDLVGERTRAGKGLHALAGVAMRRLDGRHGGKDKWEYTRKHSVDVACFAYIMAREARRNSAFGTETLDPELVFVGGLVHDIGKTFLPMAILVKELGVDFGVFTAFEGSTLNEAEKGVIRNEHIATGTRFVRLFGGGPHIRVVLDMVGLHHVSYNGEDNGVPSYPSLVRGMDLPFHSRIAKAADLISAAMPRHYRQNGHITSVEDSLAHAIAVSGMEVDPLAIQCFITGRYTAGWEEAGELVRRLSHPGGMEAISDTHRVRDYAKDVVRTDREFKRIISKPACEKANSYAQEIARCFTDYGIGRCLSQVNKGELV